MQGWRSGRLASLISWRTQVRILPTVFKLSKKGTPMQTATATTSDTSDGNEQTTAAKFAGVRGLFAQWANFGVIGVLAGLLTYSIVWGLPSMQNDFHTLIDREREANRNEIAKERQAARDEAERSRQHGDRAAENISRAIDRSTERIDSRHKEMIDVLRKIEGKTGVD